jgi:hypothetical protein
MYRGSSTSIAGKSMKRFVNSAGHHYLKEKTVTDLPFFKIIKVKRHTTKCARNTQMYVVRAYVAYSLSA